jgi:hypothetical protein
MCHTTTTITTTEDHNDHRRRLPNDLSRQLRALPRRSLICCNDRVDITLALSVDGTAADTPAVVGVVIVGPSR